MQDKALRTLALALQQKNEDEANESARNNMSQFFKPEFLNRP